MLRILLWPVLVLLLRRHDGISILAFTQKPLVSLRYRTTALPAASFTALVNLDETAARDVSALEDWAAAYGVQTAEGFSIIPAQESHEDENNFGVVTNVDLPAESPVLYVPSELILTGSTARQALDGPALQQALELLGRLEKEDDATQEFALFCKVLVEYEKGDASPYYPWLNAMPRIYYNGASMTPFCYECLPPLVASLAMKERVRFINFFEALKKVDFVQDYTKNNRELARWAFQLVCTRAFYADGDYRMAPMADMFNHGTDYNVFLSYDGDGTCYAYTTTDVPAGSKLCVSYGDPTNPSYFFAKYGFLDETSPATFCKIMLKQTSQLRDMGYEYSRMLFYKDSGEASGEVWDVLLYQNLATDFATQKAFYDAHMTGDEATKQSIHEHYYPETLASLQKHVDAFLQQLDELSQKAVGKDYRQHPRLPLILRHNAFVKETFLAVKAQLDAQ